MVRVRIKVIYAKLPIRHAHVIIYSSKLANDLATAAIASLAYTSYEVYLNNDNKLEWRTIEDGQEVILHKEPLTSWQQRMGARILQFLPIKSQL